MHTLQRFLVCLLALLACRNFEMPPKKASYRPAAPDAAASPAAAAAPVVSAGTAQKRSCPATKIPDWLPDPDVETAIANVPMIVTRMTTTIQKNLGKIR